MKITFLSIALLTVSLAHGQGVNNTVSKRGSTAAPFLTIAQGARATALGSSFTAVADDPTAIYWNPSGLADLEGVQVLFDHTSWIADINMNSVFLTYGMGDMGTIGFSYTNLDYGEIDVTTEEKPEGSGHVYDASDVVFTASWGLFLTDKFSIGFSPKVIYQSIWNMSATGAAIDVGVRYVTPFDNMVLGMVIANLGSQMQMTGRSATIIHDPDPDRENNNGKIPASYNTESWNLPLNFKIGLSWKKELTDASALLLSGEAAHPNDNFESVNLGGEYQYGDFLFFRAGYKDLFMPDLESGMSYGLGLKQLVINDLHIILDYVYTDFGRLNNTQKISVSLVF